MDCVSGLASYSRSTVGLAAKARFVSLPEAEHTGDVGSSIALLSQLTVSALHIPQTEPQIERYLNRGSGLEVRGTDTQIKRQRDRHRDRTQRQGTDAEAATETETATEAAGAPDSGRRLGRGRRALLMRAAA